MLILVRSFVHEAGPRSLPPEMATPRRACCPGAASAAVVAAHVQPGLPQTFTVQCGQGLALAECVLVDPARPGKRYAAGIASNARANGPPSRLMVLFVVGGAVAIVGELRTSPPEPRRQDLGRCAEHIERTRTPSTRADLYPRRLVTWVVRPVRGHRSGRSVGQRARVGEQHGEDIELGDRGGGPAGRRVVGESSAAAIAGAAAARRRPGARSSAAAAIASAALLAASDCRSRRRRLAATSHAPRAARSVASARFRSVGTKRRTRLMSTALRPRA